MDGVMGEIEWLESESEPKLLFKYKKVTTTLDLSRFCDSLKENRIYFSKPSNLNDSMEGMGTDLIGGVAAGLETLKDSYRVLALSESCFSPVMWSHYADNRSGICLGFIKGNPFDNDNSSAFKIAEKVKYVSNRNEFSSDTKQAIENDLYYKNSDWSYEREWRIIKETNESYITYDRSDLACIIFGEKTDEIIKELIKNTFSDIPFYCVESEPKKYRLVIRNLATRELIDGVDELFSDIEKQSH